VAATIVRQQTPRDGDHIPASLPPSGGQERSAASRPLRTPALRYAAAVGRARMEWRVARTARGIGARASPVESPGCSPQREQPGRRVASNQRCYSAAKRRC